MMRRPACYSQMNSYPSKVFSSDECSIEISDLVDFAVQGVWIKQNPAVMSLRQFENHPRIGCRPNILGSGD